MKIRVANIEDAVTIANLISDLAEKFIINEFSAQGKANFLKANNAVAIRNFINGDFHYYLAVKKTQVVGVIAVRGNSHLYHLFVQETYQGQGIARKLWQYVQSECLAKADFNRFTVNSSLNAVAVYQAFGFKKSGVSQESQGVLYQPMCLDVNG